MTEFEYTNSEDRLLKLLRRRKQWNIDELTSEFYANKLEPEFPKQYVSKLVRRLSLKLAANRHGRLVRTSRMGRGRKAIWQYRS